MKKVTDKIPGLGIVTKPLSIVWKMIQITLMIIGGITVILALVGAIFVWNLTRPTGIEAEMHPVEISEEHAESFDAKWDDFIDSGGSGTPQTLVLTEEEVSSKLTELADEHKDDYGVPLEVDNVSVNFEPGSVKMKVAVVGNFMGFPVHLAGKGEIEFRTENGVDMFFYEIEQIDLGHAPSQLKQLVEDAIGDNMSGSEPVTDEWDVAIHEFELVQTGSGDDYDKYDLNIEALLE